MHVRKNIKRLTRKTYCGGISCCALWFIDMSDVFSGWFQYADTVTVKLQRDELREVLALAVIFVERHACKEEQ